MLADDVIRLVEYFRAGDEDNYYYLDKRIDGLAEEIEKLNTSIRELLGEIHKYQRKDETDDYDNSDDYLPF